MTDEEQIITYRTYYDPMLAQIIRTRLADNGIQCFIADEAMNIINPLYNNALGGIKIKIFARDLERCDEILAEDECLATDGGEVDSDSDLACQYCGSKNIGSKIDLQKGVWRGFLDWFFPNSHKKQENYCLDCGKDFSSEV